MKTNENNMESYTEGAGLVFPALAALVIDRNDVGNYEKRASTALVSHPEADLLSFLADGVLLSTEFDDSEAGGLLKEEGYTIAYILEQQHKVRAARRHLCNRLQRYIDAVKQDEEAREAAEGDRGLYYVPESVANVECFSRAIARDAFNAFKAMNPAPSLIHVQATIEGEEFLRSFEEGQVQPLVECDPHFLREYFAEHVGAVADAQAMYQKAIALRRAFYLAVREFVTDPETWRQVEGGRAPNFEKIADELRAEGFEIKEEAPTM